MKGTYQTPLLRPQRKQSFRKSYWIIITIIAISVLPACWVHATPFSDWTTVVNNDSDAPGTAPDSQPDLNKTFFSYNQPSINDAGTVVFRARAKYDSGTQSSGGTTSGIFTRDMSVPDSEIEAIAVRGDEVPVPNNVDQPGPGTFNEFPSFPRIDAKSDTLAFRGQSNPTWNVQLSEEEETRSGTSGLYATPAGGDLITGIRNIEAEGGFGKYLVPGETDIRFEQFPGAPSPTGDKITFKGNWADADGNSQTGVFYRDLVAKGGESPVVEIAKRGEDIPTEALPEGGTAAKFDSTAPPSAAAGKMVFTGLDNEEAPTAGGIFMADLVENASLKTVAGFRTEVPNQTASANKQTLNAFGEGLSFDGRYVGFWAGWGDKTFSKSLECRSDGNSALSDACKAQSDNGDGKFTFDITGNQGIFLADTLTEELFLVAQAGIGQEFDDFLFWNFSGKPPGKGGHEESVEDDEAEGPRWRSSAFLAIDGDDVVFKAEKDGVSGLYGAMDVSSLDYNLFTILTTGMDGGLLDSMAEGMEIISLGIERDGFRNGRLAINASMDDGENSWAGIYVAPAPVPEPGTWALLSVGLAGLVIWRRKS